MELRGSIVGRVQIPQEYHTRLSVILPIGVDSEPKHQGAFTFITSLVPPRPFQR